MAKSLTKSMNMLGNNVKRLLSVDNIRLKSSGQECDLLKAIRTAPCAQSKKGMEYKKERGNFKSMWDYPDCCKEETCKDDPPRLDNLYYRSSDKSKRVYTCTWVKCPTQRIIKKKVCCLEDIKPAPIYRRPRGVRPDTACNRMRKVEEGQKDCELILVGKCPVVPLPCCRKALVPPAKCRYYPGPAKCKKPKAPFPSYSECERDPPKPLRKKECLCQYVTPNCRAYAHAIKLRNMPKSESPKCK